MIASCIRTVVAGTVLAVAGFAFAQTSAPRSSGRSAEGALAEGPMQIKVQRLNLSQKVIEDQGTLLLLTKDKLVYIPDKATVPSIYEAGQKYVQRVESLDGKHRWVFSAAREVFTGPVVAPSGFELKALPLAAGDEGRYLVYSLERFHQHMEEVLSQQDPRLLRACRERGEALVAHVRTQGLHPALGKLCESIAPYLDAQGKRWEERQQLLAEARKGMEELKRRQAQAMARQQAGALLGFAQMLLGVMPQTVGTAYDTYGNRYDIQAADDRLFAAGLSEVMKANVRYALEQGEIEMAKKAFTEATREKFLALHKEIADARHARAQAIRAVGVEHFGLPPADAQDRQEQMIRLCREGKDYRPLVELLTEQMRQDRGSGQRDNPFQLVEICRLKSLMPRVNAKKSADELFDLARQCADGVRLVPPSAVYDADRVDLLQAAARLTLTAVTVEIGDQPWTRAYHPRARYAARLLEQAGALGTLDVGGETREVLVQALMLGGRLEEALQQALDIQDLRKRSPLYHYNLSRLYGARKDTDRATSCVESAIKAGFSDLRTLRKTPELGYLAKDKRFLSFTKMNVESAVRVARATLGGPPPTGHSVEITNRSPFALGNVKLRLEVTVARARQKQLFTHTIEHVIQPGETYTWTNAFNTDLRLSQGQLVIDCDQGSATVRPGAR